MGKYTKAVGPRGFLHRLLGMLPDHTQHTLYDGVLERWRTGDIMHNWLRSEVVVLYKKGDPSHPENYCPIAVTSSIYCVTMRLYRPCPQRLMDLVANPE